MEFIKSLNKKNWCEKIIQKRFPDDYAEIIRFPGNTFSEKIYNCINNNSEVYKCPVCGKPTAFKDVSNGYCVYCSQACALTQRSEKIRKTCIERYGVDNPSKCEDIKQRKRETIEKNYGGFGWASDIISEKSKQTCIDKYGDANYSNRDKCRQTCLDHFGCEYALQSDDVKLKSKKTKLDRYGDENYTNREKAIDTCIKRYGNVTNVDKLREVMVDKYGGPSAFSDASVREKAKKTLLERYGVDTASDIPGVREKARHTHQCNQLKKIMDQYPDVISITDGVYTCRCCNDGCDKCEEKVFDIPTQSYRYRHRNNCEKCTKINPVEYDRISNTSIELFVQNILNECGVEYMTNVRNIINGLEIDVYVPSKKIAIECNGIYWHSDINKDHNYHHNKYVKCSEKGIQLITIWEDQIHSCPDKIRNMIASKLGLYNERIYARNCRVVDISNKECREFLDRYHLQSGITSKVRKGLLYNNELVSVMTFGKKRKCMRGKNEWELHRYCVKPGLQITGGASKLFNSFIRQYEPESVESFASNDISNGKLYEMLGFRYESTNVGYWYIDRHMNRYHRYVFRKSELVKQGFDADMSEREITEQLDLLRIYDSGQSKYIYKPLL